MTASPEYHFTVNFFFISRRCRRARPFVNEMMRVRVHPPSSSEARRTPGLSHRVADLIWVCLPFLHSTGCFQSTAFRPRSHSIFVDDDIFCRNALTRFIEISLARVRVRCVVWRDLSTSKRAHHSTVTPDTAFDIRHRTS